MTSNPMQQLSDHRQQARAQDDPNADISFLALQDASVRTLVTRNITDEGVTFFINKTSPKWQTISHAPEAQALFWFSSLQVQYRATGVIEEFDPSIMAENWPRRPAGSKYLDHAYQDFAPQSSVVESQQALTDHLQAQMQAVSEASLTAPDAAIGVLLRVLQLERLDLNNRNRIHDRRLFKRNGDNWVENVLMP